MSQGLHPDLQNLHVLQVTQLLRFLVLVFLFLAAGRCSAVCNEPVLPRACNGGQGSEGRGIPRLGYC